MKCDKGAVRRRIVIVGAIVLALCFVSWDLYCLRGVWRVISDARQRRVRLLYETDHAALLQACRELSRRVARGDLKPGTYYVRFDPSPEVSRFPKMIVDLVPSYVYIDENMTGRVIVAMAGGLDHFGVEAYPADCNQPISGCTFGKKELIPGLWYYDDGYDEDPRYEQRIQALKPKRGK